MTPARRPYGSGGLSQRSDGLWVGTLEAGWTEQGKRRRVTVSSMDPVVAERKLKAKRREMKRAAKKAGPS